MVHAQSSIKVEDKQVWNKMIMRKQDEENDRRLLVVEKFKIKSEAKQVSRRWYIILIVTFPRIATPGQRTDSEARFNAECLSSVEDHLEVFKNDIQERIRDGGVVLEIDVRSSQQGKRYRQFQSRESPLLYLCWCY